MKEYGVGLKEVDEQCVCFNRKIYYSIVKVAVNQCGFAFIYAGEFRNNIEIADQLALNSSKINNKHQIKNFLNKNYDKF